MRETLLAGESGVLVEPDTMPRAGLLVLGGSSGRVQTDRCRALAAAGFAALSVRWFADPIEAPLDGLLAHLDHLAELSASGETGGRGRVGVFGTSFGALAALVLGVVAPERLDIVVALAPSDLVWAAPVLTDEGRPVDRSPLSWRGEPIPHVTTLDQTVIDRSTWTGPPIDTPRALYEASTPLWGVGTFGCSSAEPFSRQAAPSLSTGVAAGELGPVVPTERITCPVILGAGEREAVWPATTYATRIAERRAAYGLDTTVLIEPEAGHRIILPGEVPAQPTQGYGYGGEQRADARLGNRVLDALLTSLPLDE